MNYYSPGLYAPYNRPQAMFGNSFYPLYNPYQPPFLPSPQYPPFAYSTATGGMTAHQERIPNDEDFYHALSNIYKLADEPELDLLLRGKTDSILKVDPFSNKIDIDFGFGPLRSLSDYEIDKNKIKYRDTFNIDDLYLFEAALLSDELLSDRDKLRRWNQRLNWENIQGIENKREYWSRMPVSEQAGIGISAGGWWAYHLFGMSINLTYGYYRLLIGPGGLFAVRNNAFRKGKIEAHYPLTGEVKIRFPFWRDGGIGLGRSLMAWVDDRPVPQPSDGNTEESKPKSGEENQSADAELINRRLLAQRRTSNMINAIMASTLRTEFPLTPYRPAVPGYQHQVPPWQAGINSSTGVYPLANTHVRMTGHNFGYPDPRLQNRAGFSAQAGKTRTRSFTESDRMFPFQQCHNSSISREMPIPSVKNPLVKPRATKTAPNNAAHSTTSKQKKVTVVEKTDHVSNSPNLSSKNTLLSSSSSLSNQTTPPSIPNRSVTPGLPKLPGIYTLQEIQEDLQKLRLKYNSLKSTDS